MAAPHWGKAEDYCIAKGLLKGRGKERAEDG